MFHHRIFILTGPVHSGKTTALRQWAHRKEKIAGILSPDLDGYRSFMDLSSERFFLMESIADPVDSTIEIGKYRFSSTAFEKARAIIRTACEARNGNTPEWLVIDEVGPLELNGGGLEPVIKTCIESYRTRENSGNLILVVRDTMLEAFMEHYQPGPCHILGIKTLTEINQQVF